MRKKKKIGIILGSGAARGLAYIGILKVLEKNNIRPDYVLGISMGSVIGAYYALNGTIDGIEEKIKVGRKDVLALIDVTKPVQSLIKGKKIKEFLEKRFGNKTFDDLKIPLAVITTDLGTGGEYIITKGRLLDALIASISIPGLLPPVKLNGKWLVDGDYSHCNPFEIIKRKAEKIIYVDVMLEEKHMDLKKLNIVKTLTLCLYGLKRKKIFNELKKKKDVVLIRPKVGGNFNYFDFHDYNKFIAEGEKAAKKKIEEIKKLISK